MRYGSVCSGIEAASVAWHPLGWHPAWFSEIEPFPCAVLKHHYPTVPNYGDMTKYKEWPDEPIDLLVGGTPCQSFSVAGLRKGLDDPRGNLALVFLGVADRYRPRWIVWENVPGVLSIDGGKVFGAFLGALGELGYGFAYRVLDAQYFGVPQRRRRVFVVGYLGDWRRAAAVLFEPESLRRHPAPSRQAGQGPAASLTRGADSSGKGGYAGRRREDDENLADGFDASEDGTGRGTPLAVVFKGNGEAFMSKMAGTLGAVSNNANGRASVMGFNNRQDPCPSGSVANPIGSKDNGGGVVSSGVRRLTPTECERLQGFPDGYTLIPMSKKIKAHYIRQRKKEEREVCSDPTCPICAARLLTGKTPKFSADGPRYRALGNSMAVPVMRWIGERIEAFAGAHGVERGRVLHDEPKGRKA